MQIILKMKIKRCTVRQQHILLDNIAFGLRKYLGRETDYAGAASAITGVVLPVDAGFAADSGV